MKQQSKLLEEVSETMFCSMSRLGYAERTIDYYRKLYAKVTKYAGEVRETYLTTEFTDGFIAEYEKVYPGDTKNARKRKAAIHRLFNMLNDCAVHGTILRHKLSTDRYLEPYAAEISCFKKYGRERGLSEASIERICFLLGKLASFLYQKNILSFTEMKKNDLQSFVETQSGFSRKTLATHMYALRILILFLNETNRSSDLEVDDVPTIRYVERRAMPKIWSEDDCRKILDVVNTGTPKGKRDYAILMLVINTGMRQCDILGMEYDNIDWSNRTVSFIQKKTGIPNSFVLDDATGWAIIDYIRNGRPSNDACKKIFLRHAAPYVPLRSFYQSLTRYLIMADIHVQPEAMHGMHSLRHSLASRLLKEDVPLGTIADIMGHADIHSAKDYLQIDMEHLRKCALEVDI